MHREEEISLIYERTEESTFHKKNIWIKESWEGVYQIQSDKPASSDTNKKESKITNTVQLTRVTNKTKASPSQQKNWLQ